MILAFVVTISFLLVGCMNVESDDLTLTLKSSNDTVEINTVYEDPGAIAKINNWRIGYDVVSDNVNTQEIGTYEILYETSYRGFTKQSKRVVTVIDETPPEVWLLPGVDTIPKDGTWVDAGVTCQDNSLQAVTVEIMGTVSANMIGEYMITYIVTDPSGNETDVVRYVNVIEMP